MSAFLLTLLLGASSAGPPASPAQTEAPSRQTNVPPTRAALPPPAADAAPLRAGAPPSRTELPPPPDDISREGPDLVRIVSRPWSPMVAVAIRYPRGSAADPPGREGALWTLALALEDAARDALEPGDGQVRIEVSRSETVVTLLAPPERWIPAYRTVVDVLDRRFLPEPSVEAARQRLLAQHAFESGSPSRSFQRELDRTIFGAASSWSRPPRGAPGTLERVGPGELEELRATHLRLDAARVAVVGNVDEEEARRELGAGEAEAELGDPDDPLPDPADPPADPADPRPVPEDPPSDPEDPRQDEAAQWEPPPGERAVVIREITNSWVGMGIAAPPDASPTELRFLAHLLEEILRPSPPDPGLYRVTADLEPAPWGPMLQIVATVFPDAAGEWEERILEALESLSRWDEDESFFRFRRRRFRGDLVERLSTPETEATWLVTGEMEGIGEVEEIIRSLDPATVRELGRRLPPPRILVYGPELRNGSP